MKLLLLATILVYNTDLICGSSISRPDLVEMPVFAAPIECEMPYTLTDNSTLSRGELRAAVLRAFADNLAQARNALEEAERRSVPSQRISVHLQYNAPLRFWQKTPKRKNLNLNDDLDKPVGIIRTKECQAHIAVDLLKVIGHMVKLP